MEMVHRFYDEYYFRPKAAFRVVWKAIVNRDVPRLYVEAKAFLKLRAQRNRQVKETRKQQAGPHRSARARRCVLSLERGRRRALPSFYLEPSGSWRPALAGFRRRSFGFAKDAERTVHAAIDDCDRPSRKLPMAHHRLSVRQYLILACCGVRAAGRYVPFARHDARAADFAGSSADTDQRRCLRRGSRWGLRC